MSNDRKARDLETRESNPVEYVYTPASSLPEPAPEDGFGFRWIATDVNGQATPMNVSRHFRDGFVPVKAIDHPEMEIQGNKDGNIEIGGLMLCKAPVEMINARKRYYEKQANQQMTSVDSTYMRENNPIMPLFTDRQTDVVRGKGFGDGKK